MGLLWDVAARRSEADRDSVRIRQEAKRCSNKLILPTRTPMESPVSACLVKFVQLGIDDFSGLCRCVRTTVFETVGDLLQSLSATQSRKTYPIGDGGHAGMADGEALGSIRYPSLRSAWIIFRARFCLDAFLTSGPRSSYWIPWCNIFQTRRQSL